MPAAVSFADSYVGRLRTKVGNDLLLLPGASCLFVDRSGRILLERRSDFGIWGVPGGNAEPGEDIVTSIRREMLEETGYEAPELTPFGFASDPATKSLTFPNGHRCQFFVLLFWAPWPESLMPVPSAESLEFGWFDPNGLPVNCMPATPVSIAAYGRFKAGGGFQLV